MAVHVRFGLVILQIIRILVFVLTHAILGRNLILVKHFFDQIRATLPFIEALVVVVLFNLVIELLLLLLLLLVFTIAIRIKELLLSLLLTRWLLLFVRLAAITILLEFLKVIQAIVAAKRIYRMVINWNIHIA